MNESFWTIDSKKSLIKYTENIYTIINEQIEYLNQITDGKVFAVFGEITVDGSLINIAKTMSDVFKNIQYMPILEEKIGDVSTRGLIDIGSAYQERRMGFEICTNNYRFRIFELKMRPIYPVIMKIDEDIFSKICEKEDIGLQVIDQKSIVIEDEDTFCTILKNILQTPKVIYLINELMERIERDEDKIKTMPDKIIICEGRTDAIILQAIVNKIGGDVSIISADGKGYIPNMFKRLKDNASIMIVADSDGDEEITRKTFEEQLGQNDYRIAIINNQIEDWFAPKLDGFSKLEILQKIDKLVDECNFSEIMENHDSFRQVINFIEGK